MGAFNRTICITVQYLEFVPYWYLEFLAWHVNNSLHCLSAFIIRRTVGLNPDRMDPIADDPDHPLHSESSAWRLLLISAQRKEGSQATWA